MESSDPVRKFCGHCFITKPIAEFRRRTADGLTRLNQCNSCHSAAERDRRAYKRNKHERRQMRQQLVKLKNAKTNRQVELVCTAMVHEFGGVPGFATHFALYFQRAKRDRGLGALRCFEALLRLMEHADAVRAEARTDLGLLSDEDLEREQLRSTQHSIRENPQLAIDAAKQLGWTITPPRTVRADHR